MALNPQNVYVGAPDQVTTGAVATAPVGSTLPTDAVSALDSAFTYGGYVTEDGVKLSRTYNTKDLFAWGGNIVRKILDTFTGEISYSEMETSEESMTRLFGSDYVAATAATASSGNRLAVSVGAHLPAEQVFVFNMKDENRRMRVVVPRGRVSNYDDTQFVHNDAISWGVTITCLDDGTGNSLYIYTDDGLSIAVQTPEIVLDHSNVQLGVGDTLQLHARTIPGGESVTWTSSTASKASVSSNGLLTALEAGTTTITAKITVNTVNYTDTCSVTVS